MNKKIVRLLEQKNIADCIQQWGSAISIALLDPTCNIFTTPIHNGIIGYRSISKYVIVFGDPVCPQEAIGGLTSEFHIFCSQNNKKIVYVATSEKFKQWMLQTHCNSSIEWGVHVTLNPKINVLEKTGRRASTLRNKFNQAARNGMVFKEYHNPDLKIEEEMQKVHTAWLRNRKGAQIYLYPVDLFNDRHCKRWFYTKYNNEIVGVLMLNRIDAHNGWALNILMIKPNAPAITSEFLILSVLELLRKENCAHFSIGVVPLNQLEEIEGLGSVSQWFARAIYKIAKKLFNLEDRHRYWRKFSPSTQRTFVLLSHPTIKFSEIIGIINALNAKI